MSRTKVKQDTGEVVHAASLCCRKRRGYLTASGAQSRTVMGNPVIPGFPLQRILSHWLFSICFTMTASRLALWNHQPHTCSSASYSCSLVICLTPCAGDNWPPVWLPLLWYIPPPLICGSFLQMSLCMLPSSVRCAEMVPRPDSPMRRNGVYPCVYWCSLSWFVGA